MKKIKNEVILEEIKFLRKDIGVRFDDVVKHSLDIRKILDSHTEMIGGLAVDLEEIKLDIKYEKR